MTFSVRKTALLAALAIPWIATCENVTVTAVDVARVVVTPSTVQIPPGERQQLSVSITDQVGNALTGRQVSWTSTDTDVATVSPGGMVTAIGAGSAEIRATAEGVSNRSVITVDRTGEIALDVGAVDLVVRQGVGGEPGMVQITNSGSGSLTGLTLQPVEYENGSGWLSPQLSGSAAPATLTVTVVSSVVDALSPGIYRATIVISAPNAANGPVRIPVELTVSPPKPAIGVSPPSATFAITEGDTPSTVQVISVTNIGGETLTGLTRAISYDQVPTGWLNASLSRSEAPANLSLSLNGSVAGFAVGTYTARVRLTSPVAVNAPVEVIVSLTVGEPPPAIFLSNRTVDFVAIAGDVSPTPQTVLVTNGGGGDLKDLRYSVRWDQGDAGWMTLSYSNPSAPSELTFAPDIEDLAAGTYVATVAVGSPFAENSPQNVTVTLVVQTPAVLTLASDDATFTASQNGASPAQQTIAVSNGGEAPLTGLTATVINYVGGQDGWLSASLDGTEAPTTLRLTATLGSRTPDTLAAQVVVASPDASNGPDTVDVEFQIALSAPAAPSALATTNETTTSVDLTFTDNANNEAGFVVQARTGGGSWSTIASPGPAAGTGTTVTVTHSGLLAGQLYDYRVWSQNAAGESAKIVLSPGGYTQPVAPTINSATPASPNSVTITWTSNNGDGVSFAIQRSPNGTNGWATLVTRTATQTGPHTDLTAPDGSTLYYRITATTPSGTATSPTVSATTVLSPPTNVTAGSATSSSITISWTDNSASETGYIVRRGGTPVTTTAANATSYTDNSGLADGTNYAYTVEATNGGGASGQVAATPNPASTLLAAPSGLGGVSNGIGTEVALTWTDNSVSETGYEVRRNGGVVTTTAANATSYTVTGLTPGSTSNYQVCTKKAGFTDQCTAVLPVTTSNPVPGPPSSVTAAAASTSSVTVSWADTISNETAFVVRRGATIVQTTAANATSYTDTGLTDGTGFTYTVQAINGAGGSAQVTAAPNPVFTLLIAPSGLTATPVAGGVSMDLTWTDGSSGEDNFDVQVDDVSVGSAAANSGSFTVTGLTASTTYTFKVCAVKSGGSPPAACTSQSATTTASQEQE